MRSKRCRGFTLLEAMVSVSILTVVGGGVFAVMIETHSGFQQTVQADRLRDRGIEMLESMRGLFEETSATQIDVKPGATHDELRIRVPFEDKGTITWGAVARERGGMVTYPGHQLLVHLVPDARAGTFSLVRDIEDSKGKLVGRRTVLARNIALGPDGESGFAVEQDGRFFTVTVRLGGSGAEQGRGPTREVSALFRVRNLDGVPTAQWPGDGQQ